MISKTKIRILCSISWLKFIRYNFFCKNVQRLGKGYILPYKHSILDISKKSRIILHNGHFVINESLPKHSKAEAYIRLGNNAVLEILESSYICYHSTIEVHANAVVRIGSAYINTGAVILASDGITIGKDVLISRGVFIYDADHHPIVNEQDEQINLPKPVIIHDHVWIGLKSTLLRGSQIGTGAVIAAHSVVGGKIKAGTMASGNPARSYSEVKWRSS